MQVVRTRPARTGRSLKGGARKAILGALLRSHRKPPMFKLGQETITIVIAIVAVGASLATLNITSYNGVRSDMQAMPAEARADREAWQAETRALRTQAGADREALGRLTGIVEEVRTARR